MADSYRTVSWKNKTRDARGEANRTIMKSVETKTLDSREFLNNNYNKTELVDQIFYWFKINRAKELNNLRITNIYFSKENFCVMLTYSSVREVDELTSTHKEADFRLVLHAQHSLKSESATLTRPHSGDTDIFVMVLFAFPKEPLVIDTCTLTSRKVISMTDVNVNDEELKVLIGFHAMTGSDYVSSFLEKGNLPVGKK